MRRKLRIKIAKSVPIAIAVAGMLAAAVPLVRAQDDQILDRYPEDPDYGTFQRLGLTWESSTVDGKPVTRASDLFPGDSVFATLRAESHRAGTLSIRADRDDSGVHRQGEPGTAGIRPDYVQPALYGRAGAVC